MIDLEKLDLAIRESGKKRKHLAAKLGITPPTFQRYCKKPGLMRGDMIETLCQELGISDPAKKEEIFFAKQG